MAKFLSAGRRAPMAIALRASLVLMVCAAVWVTFGDTLARASLPLLRWTYERIDSEHSVRRFDLSNSNVTSTREKVFLLEVAPDGLVLVGQRVVDTNPEGWAQVSVLSAFLLQPLSIAIAIAAAWPTSRRAEWAFRGAALLPLGLSAAVIDLPFVLWGEVWKLYQPMFAPGDVYPLLIWTNFLQGGGRYVVGLVAGATAVALGARTVRAWPSSNRSAVPASPLGNRHGTQ